MYEVTSGIDFLCGHWDRRRRRPRLQSGSHLSLSSTTTTTTSSITLARLPDIDSDMPVPKQIISQIRQLIPPLDGSLHKGQSGVLVLIR